MKNSIPYLKLMRFHKPIGILLLLWPTLTALWMAGNGKPTISNILIFTFGVIMMRAAGCVINDIADRHFDLHVTRTKDRPLTTQQISIRSAITLFVFLCVLAFILVLLTNIKTILLSCGAILVAMIYPFMKRYTHWPQLILGIAFSFGIPMSFAAENHPLSLTCWLLFFSNIAWTIAYDTAYAMTDKKDDLAIGIKSTAIFFGQHVKQAIVFFQGCFLLGLIAIGYLNDYANTYYIGIVMILILFFHQYHKLEKTPLTAFLNNQWVGLILFLTIFYQYV